MTVPPAERVLFVGMRFGHDERIGVHVVCARDTEAAAQEEVLRDAVQSLAEEGHHPIERDLDESVWEWAQRLTHSRFEVRLARYVADAMPQEASRASAAR